MPTPDAQAGIRHLLCDARFEVIPRPGIEEAVSAVLPAGTTVHVMCPPAEGAEYSISVALGLAARDLAAVPHVAARTVASRDHLVDLLGRMKSGGINEAFFPGGDGKVPRGTYTSAVQLLEDLATLDHGLHGIGIASYPEGHREIDASTLLAALLAKQHIATYMVTENCFDPAQIIAWLNTIRQAGVKLPVRIGVPGLVPIRRLVEALDQFGLKAAVHYLRKQHGMASSLLRRRFSPETVLAGISPQAQDASLNIAGLHFFTFNEIAATESWRQNALAAAMS